MRIPLRQHKQLGQLSTEIAKMSTFAILALAAFLNLYKLNNEGFGNTYYAAGVKSMLTSWHNFFFVSFDPSGFVSLDKPPIGFWIQALSAKLLGFSGWSVIFPQALAGILSVYILYVIVAKTSGAKAGKLAALFMAVSPIAVATSRNNTIDSLLVLIVLLATLALLKAIETASLSWWLVSMALIGVGFNIKMAQALFVVPGCLFIIFYKGSGSLKKRILHMFLGGMVLVLFACVWMAIVDLTPPSQRPYVGGSQTNSTFNLALSYNGLTRLIGLPQIEPPSLTNSAPNQPNDGILPDEIGKPGIFRLFTRELAGQASWLLPLALISFALLIRLSGGQEGPVVRYRFDIFWGIWLIFGLAFFSVASFFHRHYLIMLVPPIAVLSSIGLTTLVDRVQKTKWSSLFLPGILLVELFAFVVILVPYHSWSEWLLPSITGIGVISIVGCIISNRNILFKGRIWIQVFFSLGVAFLIIPQLIWAAIPVLERGNGYLPFAGPDVLTWNRYPTDVDISSLIDDLNQNYQGEKYFVGTLDYDPAEWIILKTGKPVMVIGGFYGTDPILSTSTLAQYVAEREIRYFFVYEDTVHKLRPDLQPWFHQNCIPNYSVPSNSDNYFQLYDCKRGDRATIK